MKKTGRKTVAVNVDQNKIVTKTEFVAQNGSKRSTEVIREKGRIVSAKVIR